jgi:hypothetical protein
MERKEKYKYIGIIAVLSVALAFSLMFSYVTYQDAREWEFSANETADMYNQLNEECTGYTSEDQENGVSQ